MSYLDFHATDAERAEADRLAKIDAMANGVKIHDLSVSCYTGTGEDGRPEDVHERRMSNGGCRCGYYRPRPVTFNTPDGPHVCPDPRFHKSECDH